MVIGELQLLSVRAGNELSAMCFCSCICHRRLASAMDKSWNLYLVHLGNKWVSKCNNNTLQSFQDILRLTCGSLVQKFCPDACVETRAIVSKFLGNLYRWLRKWTIAWVSKQLNIKELPRNHVPRTSDTGSVSLFDVLFVARFGRVWRFESLPRPWPLRITWPAEESSYKITPGAICTAWPLPQKTIRHIPASDWLKQERKLLGISNDACSKSEIGTEPKVCSLATRSEGVQNSRGVVESLIWCLWCIASGLQRDFGMYANMRGPVLVEHTVAGSWFAKSECYQTGYGRVNDFSKRPEEML